MFSKVKAILAPSQRSHPAPPCFDALAVASDVVTPADAHGWFTHAAIVWFLLRESCCTVIGGHTRGTAQLAANCIHQRHTAIIAEMTTSPVWALTVAG
jgi:hypothetical protein